MTFLSVFVREGFGEISFVLCRFLGVMILLLTFSSFLVYIHLPELLQCLFWCSLLYVLIYDVSALCTRKSDCEKIETDIIVFHCFFSSSVLSIPMEEILAKASSQAVTFAIRSGISLASGFAIKTVTKLLDKIPENDKKKIILGRNKIQTKIDILSVSIDLIKLVAARGNTSLESTIELITNLNLEIDTFDEIMNQIVRDINSINEKDLIKKVESMMKDLISEINDAIPLINLSLITCGVSLNGNLPSHVSPGRLLQASNHIITSNNVFDGTADVIVGPTFDLVMYSIFYNPSRMKYIEENSGLLCITWKEDLARCLAQIIRTKSSNEVFNYKFVVTEDFDDGRYHEDEAPVVKEYTLLAVKRLFFSASGKLLKLESRSSPVLIFKLEKKGNEEWIAFGEVGEKEFDEDSDSDDEEEVEVKAPKQTSLSLVEYLVRLSTLQEHDSKSILEISDEKLSLYLHDEKAANVETQSVVPKSKKEVQAQLKNSERTNEIMTLDSNISRLKTLELDK